MLACVTEKGNTTTGLHICRRTSKGKIYDEQEVTLNLHAISILKKILDEIKLYQEDMTNKIQTTNNDFDKILINDEFLKRNLWLFGNEYTTFVEEEKINAKNILDGIPKTFENFIDVIEVKLPEVELFRYDQNHNNYYSSSDLVSITLLCILLFYYY